MKAITLFTDDRAASGEFYRLLLRAEPIFEDDASTVFRVGQTMVNLLQNDAVPELLEPKRMAAAGIRAVYSLEVSSVDEDVARLRAAGISVINGPIDRPWGVRTANLADPSGHIWELAQGNAG